MKLELLTNATVVDDAIRFVSSSSIEKIKKSSYSNSTSENESDEPDYNEDECQQEEKTGEITRNQVF